MDAKQIDWVTIISKIRRHMTWEALAFELDTHASSLQKTIGKGSEPRYSTGLILLDLYQTKVGEEIPTLPYQN